MDRAKTITVKQRKISEKSLANLKPFKPGQSGNPAGRPKAITLSEAYAKELAAESLDGVTNAEAVAKEMVAKAKRGSLAAASEISDRTEGKPKQAHEHSGPNGGAIQEELVLILKVWGDDATSSNGDSK